jgi:DNA-binding CsgD family transcriptional regulator
MQTAVDACPTRHIQLILQIVDGVYAAACGEATWEQVLAKICRFGGLDGGALSTVGAVEPRQVPLASFGPGSQTNQCASAGAMPNGPRLADIILRSIPGTVLRGRQMIMPDPPTIPSRRTVSVPVEAAVTWACVIVGKDKRRVVCLEVHRRDMPPSASPEPDDLLRQLGPHLVRAWRIGGASPVGFSMSVPPASRAQVNGDVAPADLAGLPEAARLRAEFGLTKAEARLALRLAEGSSLASAAQAFDVKLTTIRSQLQQVFAKTGTSRQTELVAVLLGRGYAYQRPPRNSYRSMQAEVALAG